MNKQKKLHTSMDLMPATVDQLDWLAVRWGNRTKIIAIAIERMYAAERLAVAQAAALKAPDAPCR